MKFKDVNVLHKQNFIRFCLVLFPSYRSAKFKNNGDIVFWKKKKTLFDNKVVIPFEEIVYKHIPLQLSMYKWRTLSKYNEYFKQIDSIFKLYGNINDKFDMFNSDWLKNEIHDTIVININKPFIDKCLIKIKSNGNIAKTTKLKNKKRKLSIKSDYLDPCIQRIKNFDLSHSARNIKVALVAASVAALIRINLVFTPLSNFSSEFVVENKKDVFTEQPLYSNLSSENTYLIPKSLYNNRKFKFFDTS